MRNTALAFSIVMIIFLLGKNLYAIDTTYIENKKGGFIYKEDLEGNQFIFYGTNIVISTKIRSCDIYFTKSEESIPKLMSRKCVNGELGIKELGYGWVRISYIAYNSLITTFYHKPTNSVVSGSDIGSDLNKIITGRSGHYIISADGYNNEFYFIHILFINGKYKELFRIPRHGNSSYPHVFLLKNKKILIEYVSLNGLNKSNIISINQ